MPITRTGVKRGQLGPAGELRGFDHLMNLILADVEEHYVVRLRVVRTKLRPARGPPPTDGRPQTLTLGTAPPQPHLLLQVPRPGVAACRAAACGLGQDTPNARAAAASWQAPKPSPYAQFPEPPDGMAPAPYCKEAASPLRLSRCGCHACVHACCCRSLVPSAHWPPPIYLPTCMTSIITAQ